MIFFHTASTILVPTSPQKLISIARLQNKVCMLQSARGLPLVCSRRQLCRSDCFIPELFLCANVLLRPMGGSRGIIWMRDQTVLDGNLDVIWLMESPDLLFDWKQKLWRGWCMGSAQHAPLVESWGNTDVCEIAISLINMFFVNAADILAQILGEHAVFPQFSLPHPATKFNVLRHANYDDPCAAKDDQISQGFGWIAPTLSEPWVVYGL